MFNPVVHPMFCQIKNWRFRIVVFVTVLLTSACSSPPQRPPIPELKPLEVKENFSVLWTYDLAQTVPRYFVGATDAPFVYAATVTGDIVKLIAQNGTQVWKKRIEQGIAAGISVNHNHIAFIDRQNVLQVLDAENGNPLWKELIPSGVLTPAWLNEDVLVLKTNSENILVFDIKTGKKWWLKQGRTPILSLESYSGIVGIKDNVVVGTTHGTLASYALHSGRLIWETSISQSSGATDIERLAAIVGSPVIAQNFICARSYQWSVGCLTSNGALQWKKKSEGFTSLTGNDQMLIGIDTDSIISAYKPTNGEIVWQNDQLKYRRLGSPKIIGNYVLVGDAEGYLHILSAYNGELLNRMRLTHSAIELPAVIVDNVVVVQTSEGLLVGIQPQ